MSIKLNAANLSRLPSSVQVPAYDRSTIKTGIVHVGIGGFHRAHEAWYTDELVGQGKQTEWGICGIALLEQDRRIYDVLHQQDGLYTLIITDPNGITHARVIGSIIEVLFAPANPERVIEKMAHPGTRIISLTITEGAYTLETPLVEADIVSPGHPKTIFGFLTQSLKRRRDQGLKGLTIQSCDNLQQNGEVAKEKLLAFIALAEPDLHAWVSANVSFPNSMVDRITPVTTPEAITLLKDHFGVDDSWPVTSEPFAQWIIEDNFISGRPAWDLVGAQFVDDVHPYEKMKIRLLNGGHVAVGLTGILKGYSTVEEAMADFSIYNFLKGFLDEDVTPVLDSVPGIDLEEYIASILQRFSNPNIKDQLSRIISQNSAKIPKFLLPTITDNLARGVVSERGAILLAAWCHYFDKYTAEDIINQLLEDKALESLTSDPLAFLKVQSLFQNLSANKAFSNRYLNYLSKIRQRGISYTLPE